jgi:hypothetical protein
VTDPRRVLCRASFHLALSPERALELFTPDGERRWVEGWDPAFPAGASDQAGTVFTTAHHRETIWVIVERAERAVRYARVVPGEDAGSGAVVCARDRGGTTVEVTYDLTALTPHAAAGLREFAAGYDGYLDGWRRRIETLLAQE